MPRKPSVFVAVYAGEPFPVVLSTACNRTEDRMLAAWLAEHPDLDELVRRAIALADPDEVDRS